MTRTIARFLLDKKAATAIEYGLIAGLVSVALVTVLSTLGGDLTALFTKISGVVATVK